MNADTAYSGAGWLEWGGVLGASGGFVLLVAVTALAGAYWWRALARLPIPRRAVLAGLRAAALALLLFLLLRPILVQPVYEKSMDVVALLFDDSASMRVRDGQGQSRADRLLKSLEDNAPEFDYALGSRFHVLDYRFGSRARPLEARESLRFESPETRIVDAVAQVARDTDTLSVSAIIVLSDGGQQEPVTEEGLRPLHDAGVPVYTVGIGEAEWRDLAIGEVALSRSFFDDAPARITAQFSASGLAGKEVAADVLHNGVVQASEERWITRDHAEQQVQLEVTPIERDWLDYTVRLRVKHLIDAEATREFVSENNEASVLLDYRKKEYRILYFSGRPNWQNKFLRRALAADPELRLSSLIRISGAEKSFVFEGAKTSLGNPLFDGFEDKGTLPRYDEAVFTRIGLGEDELKNGYPTTAAELYPFDLIIWGDIEAEFFAPAHLRLTRDAVAERGASFLMLGGPRALADPGYAGSVIESLLPVMPGSVAPAYGPDGESARIEPSPEGFLTGVMALNADSAANAKAWEALPVLPEVDTITSTRIGASVMASARKEGAGTTGGEETPFLLWQRFGQGKSAVLATGETWPWHMQTEAGNESHERLWRQSVRSLVSTVPGQVTLAVHPEVAVAGVESTLAWTVKNELFERVEGASLHVRVVDPDGANTTIPLLELLDIPGTYEGPFLPAAAGTHRMYLEGANADGAERAPVESAVLVRPDTREVASAQFDPALLERVARETGGQYFPLSSLGQVAAAVTPKDREYARLDRQPVWHHPGFYAALLVLLCAEWALRRRWGQA